MEALLLAVAAVPAIGIVALYWQSRWWETTLGKGMSVTALAMALILTVAAVTAVVPAIVPVVEHLVAPLYLLLAVGLWLKFIAFARLERTRREHLREIALAAEKDRPIPPAPRKENP